MAAEKNQLVRPEESSTRKVDDLHTTDSRFDSERAELFEALGHETRIRILQTLSESPASFCELKRRVNIESSGNLSFHLGKLGDMVKTGSSGDYSLTDEGKEALRVIDTSIQCGTSRNFLLDRRVSLKFNFGIIAISLVWAAMMVAVSLVVRGDPGLGTNLLFVEIGGFIATLSILSWLGRVR